MKWTDDDQYKAELLIDSDYNIEEIALLLNKSIGSIFGFVINNYSKTTINEFLNQFRAIKKAYKKGEITDEYFSQLTYKSLRKNCKEIYRNKKSRKHIAQIKSLSELINENDSIDKTISIYKKLREDNISFTPFNRQLIPGLISYSLLTNQLPPKTHRLSSICKLSVSNIIKCRQSYQSIIEELHPELKVTVDYQQVIVNVCKKAGLDESIARNAINLLSLKINDCQTNDYHLMAASVYITCEKSLNLKEVGKLFDVSDATISQNVKKLKNLPIN